MASYSPLRIITCSPPCAMICYDENVYQGGEEGSFAIRWGVFSVVRRHSLQALHRLSLRGSFEIRPPKGTNQILGIHLQGQASRL